MNDASGRAKLLDAAERLFAEQGIEATSGRAINAAANLSPAALHYHFGNKEWLVYEVLRRRMQGLNESRTEMIAEFVERGNPKDIISLAEIIILPLVGYAIDRDAPGHWYIRFLSRLYAEQREMLLDFLETEHEEGVELFDAMIQAAGPQLPMDEVRRRRRIAGEAIIHELAKLAGDMHASSVAEAARDQRVESLVRFVSGGLVAPLE